MSINYTIHQLFPTVVMEFNLEKLFSPEEVISLKNLITKTTPHNLIPDGFTTYSSIMNLLLLQEFTFLKNILDKCVNEYVKTLDLQPLIISRCWTSFLHKGSSTKLHRHEASVVSGALYIQATTDSSPLIFHSPIKPYRHFDLFIEPNDANSYFGVFPAKQFILYIFPSWLDHETETETSTDVRQVISFNTNYQHFQN